MLVLVAAAAGGLATALPLLLLPAVAGPGAGNRGWDQVAARLDTFLSRRYLRLTRPRFLLLAMGVPLLTQALVLGITGSWLVTLLAAPAGVLVLSTVLGAMTRRELSLVRADLLELVLSLAAGLRAGLSLTQAIDTALGDLTRLQLRRPSILLAELAAGARAIRLNAPIDEVLERLTLRLPLDELRDVVGAIHVTRHQGGNLAAVLDHLAHMIGDRLAVQREIQAVTAEKRLEAAVLCGSPLVLYVTMRALSGPQVGQFFATTVGEALLGIALLLSALAYWLAQRLSSVDV